MTRRVAAIFDLDGTLVQTEALKARSYARAAVELRPDVAVQEIIAAYDEMVGRSREEVAAALLSRFELAPFAEQRQQELGVATPLDAYMALRLRIYEAMIAREQLIREQEYPWSTTLLRELHGRATRWGSRPCRIASTLSSCWSGSDSPTRSTPSSRART